MRQLLAWPRLVKRLLAAPRLVRRRLSGPRLAKRWLASTAPLRTMRPLVSPLPLVTMLSPVGTLRLVTMQPLVSTPPLVTMLPLVSTLRLVTTLSLVRTLRLAVMLLLVNTLPRMTMRPLLSTLPLTQMPRRQQRGTAHEQKTLLRRRLPSTQLIPTVPLCPRHLLRAPPLQRLKLPVRLMRLLPIRRSHMLRLKVMRQQQRPRLHLNQPIAAQVERGSEERPTQLPTLHSTKPKSLWRVLTLTSRAMMTVRMKKNCLPQAPTPANSSRDPATLTTRVRPLTRGLHAA